MLKNDRYTYRVTWSEEDEEYVGLCVEYPSLSWLAPTPQDALEGIRQVVADVVADMEAHEEAVPDWLVGQVVSKNSMRTLEWERRIVDALLTGPDPIVAISHADDWGDS